MCGKREHSNSIFKHNQVAGAKEGDFCVAHRLPMQMFCAPCRVQACLRADVPRRKSKRPSWQARLFATLVL
jgi:hypothetical protein